MPFKRRLKDKYAGSSPENASVVRTLFDLFLINLKLIQEFIGALHARCMLAMKLRLLLNITALLLNITHKYMMQIVRFLAFSKYSFPFLLSNSGYQFMYEQDTVKPCNSAYQETSKFHAL